MAFVRTEHCRVCEQATQHVNGKCVVCDEREKRKRIAIWNALTIEERLSNLRRRVERLEQGTVRY